MATKTNNLGLSKAELTDAVRSTLTANNGNFDTLDSTYQSMKEQINRLKSNQITGTASGTEIVVEDSAEMESILHISGNSEQDSRSGKNLFDITKIQVGEIVDGDIRLQANQNTFYDYDFKENTQYTFSAYVKSSGSGGVRLRIIYTDGSNSMFLNPDGSTEWVYREFTSVAGKTIDYINVTYGSAGYLYIKEGKLQIEEGSVATPYEPYGAMPSPDYPSEIRSVKSKSDNLLPFPYPNTSPYTINGITFTPNEDGSITINGTATKNAQMYLVTSEQPLKLKGTYTMSCEKSPQGNIIFRGVYTKSDGSESYFSNTFTTPGEVLARPYLVIISGETINNLTVHPMLNKGTVALPFQPYGYVPVEAKVEGKNLLFVEDKEVTTNYGALTCSAKDQSITINGTASSGNTIALINDVNSTTPIIKFEANQTYYMKMYYESGDVSNKASDIQLRNAHGNIVAKPMNEWINGFTYTTTEDVEITWLRFYLGAYTFTNYKFKLQVSRIKLNEWVTPAPLKTLSLPLGDIELRSTPDGTRDTFERVDGVWNKVSNIGSVVFNGSETWDVGKFPVSGSIQFQRVVSGMLASSKLMCNRFINSSVKNGIIVGTVCNIYLDTDYNVTTATEFKTWLSTHNTEVIYRLTTPTYTPITDTALIQALDELEQLILHKGYNRITVTGVNGVKAYLDLSYIKDINAVLDNINAIILTLGGGENV